MTDATATPTMAEIQELVRCIVAAFAPQKVILFGSHAYGRPDAGSDVDLLVILPFEGKGYRKALEIVLAVQPEFPVDILARTPDDVRQRLAWNDFFLREIVERGTVLYAAPGA